MLSAIPAAAIFEAAGVLHFIEEPLVRLVGHQAKTPESPVAVVEISDSDFREIFRGQRPLPPDKLDQVIGAIAALGPKAIAVDIDTSNPVYKVLGGRRWWTPGSPDAGAPAREVPVVWARRIVYSHRTARFYPEDTLGGAGAPRTAVAALIADSDGAVRRYRRSFPTDCCKLLALPIELLKAGGLLQPGEEDGERIINFYGHTSGLHRRHYWTGAVLQAASDPDIAAGRNLQDKVVLFGGAFHGIDEHQTPLGWMWGVELLAHIAETDAHNAVPTTRTVLNFIVVLGACLIAICFDTTRGRKGVRLAAAGIIAGFLLSWWYTRLARDALLVGTVLLVIAAQRVYAAWKQALAAEDSGRETDQGQIRARAGRGA